MSAPSLDKLYELCDQIDSKEKTDAEKSTLFVQALEGTKGDEKTKKMTYQIILRYFAKFPDARDAAFEAVYSLCEGTNIETRKSIVKDLPLLCKEPGSHVTKIADILTQLLQTDDPGELKLIHMSLLKILNDSKYTRDTLSTILGHIMSGESDIIRDRALKFLAIRPTDGSEQAFTAEIQQYLYDEMKKVLADVTGDEFILIMHILGNLEIKQTLQGRKDLFELVIEQCDLDKPFPPNDVDRAEQICQCFRQAAAFMSRNVPSNKLVEYHMVNVIPQLSKLNFDDADSTRLELLRVLAELMQFCGPFTDKDTGAKYANALMDLLISYLPALPSAEAGQDQNLANGQDKLDPKDKADDVVPDVKFSPIECILASFQVMCKLAGGNQFLTAKENEDRVKDLKKKLQYVARLIQVYQPKLKAKLSTTKKPGEEMTDDEKTATIALKTTMNIFRIAKDLLHVPPKLDTTMAFSWKKSAGSSPAKREHSPPPSGGAGGSPGKRPRITVEPQLYQGPKGKYSDGISKFDDTPNYNRQSFGWRGRGGFRGRGFNRSWH